MVFGAREGNNFEKSAIHRIAEERQSKLPLGGNDSCSFELALADDTH